MFVPAFTGLGSPYWDPYARHRARPHRGTGRAQLAARSSRRWRSRPPTCRRDHRGRRHPLTELRVDGGASVMDVLCQFQADVLGVTVRRPVARRRRCSAPPSLAGIAEGVWASPAEAASAWREDAAFLPAPLPPGRRAAGRLASRRRPRPQLGRSRRLIDAQFRLHAVDTRRFASAARGQRGSGTRRASVVGHEPDDLVAGVVHLGRQSHDRLAVAVADVLGELRPARRGTASSFASRPAPVGPPSRPAPRLLDDPPLVLHLRKELDLVAGEREPTAVDVLERHEPAADRVELRRPCGRPGRGWRPSAPRAASTTAPARRRPARASRPTSASRRRPRGSPGRGARRCRLRPGRGYRSRAPNPTIRTTSSVSAASSNEDREPAA